MEHVHVATECRHSVCRQSVNTSNSTSIGQISVKLEWKVLWVNISADFSSFSPKIIFEFLRVSHVFSRVIFVTIFS